MAKQVHDVASKRRSLLVFLLYCIILTPLVLYFAPSYSSVFGISVSKALRITLSSNVQVFCALKDFTERRNLGENKVLVNTES